MKCPYCGSEQTFVKDSREGDDGRYRREQCAACGERFSTVEKPVFRSSAKTRKIRGRCAALRGALETALQVLEEMERDNGG